MPNYPLPYWWNATISGPTLPDFYWNVKSQEERIKKICEDLWKLIQVYKLLVDAINDHEERISELERKVAEIEQQIAQILQTLEELSEHVDDLEDRLTVVEGIIANLENTVITIINTYVDSPEFIAKLTLLINQLTAGKMNKVPSANENNFASFDDNGQVMDSGYNENDFIPRVQAAIANNIATWTVNGNVQDSGKKISDLIPKVQAAVANNIATWTANGYIQDSGKKIADFILALTNAVENNIATFDAAGKVKDSGKSIVTTPSSPSSNDNTIPTSLAVMKSIFTPTTETVLDNIPLSRGTYFLSNSSSWAITVNTLTYKTNCIHVDPIINQNDMYVMFGWFTNPSNPTPVLMLRYYDDANQQWGAWKGVSHEYIEATEQTAATVSAANPNALVYVPEV